MLDIIKNVANAFINEHFPTCNVAILAGSYVRGDQTATSDLDIVVIDDSYQSSFRQSFIYEEYPIECFVHNNKSLLDFVNSDIQRARPSLLKMIVEGVILIDDGSASSLKQKMNKLLSDGPTSLTEEQKQLKQYFLTDLLEDFEGATKREEEIFIAMRLAESLHEFILRMNNKWIGSGKWVYRALKKYDQYEADNLYQAVDSFLKDNNKVPLINLTDNWLNQFGGRLFEGFQLGSKKKC
jgi:hypothetical protein